MIDQHAPAILYAEDDADDRLLAELAHRESGVRNPLIFVVDGEDALDCLRTAGRHADQADQPRPGIVLLDLNMPGIDGRETLRIIRSDPTIRRIPVVILTTSTANDDIAASYDAGASAHIVKPTAFNGLVHIFSTLAAFWFDVSSLAKETPRSDSRSVPATTRSASPPGPWVATYAEGLASIERHETTPTSSTSSSPHGPARSSSAKPAAPVRPFRTGDVRELTERLRAGRRVAD